MWTIAYRFVITDSNTHFVFVFQVHRNHLSLPWPVQQVSLLQRPVKISMATEVDDVDSDNDLISKTMKLKGQTCDSLRDLESVFSAVDCVQKTDSSTDNIITSNS